MLSGDCGSGCWKMEEVRDDRGFILWSWLPNEHPGGLVSGYTILMDHIAYHKDAFLYN
jgi:hypothetical protein